MMSELDDIKARAAGYRTASERVDSEKLYIILDQVVVDLDRAIAIAQENQHRRDLFADAARICAAQRDEARAAALLLRKVAGAVNDHHMNGMLRDVLADTEWLEEYR